MALLTRLPEETLSEVERGAGRLAEAVCLLVTGRWGGSVYLAGYVVEMLLKVAYFKMIPLPGPLTVRQLVGSVKGPAQAKLGAGRLPGGWAHDLGLWLELVIDERARVARPLPVSLQHELRARIGTMKANWSVDMRYVRIPARLKEAIGAVSFANWLRRNYLRLV